MLSWAQLLDQYLQLTPLSILLPQGTVHQQVKQAVLQALRSLGKMLKHSSSPGTTAPPQAGCAVLSPPVQENFKKNLLHVYLWYFLFSFLYF